MSVLTETELFPLDVTFDAYAKQVKIYEYKVQAESKILELFDDLSDLTYFISQKIDGIFYNSDGGPCIVRKKQLSDSELNVKISDNISIDLIPVSSNRTLDTVIDHTIILKLIYKDLRSSIENSGFKIKGSSAFKIVDEINITSDKGSTTNNLDRYLGVYAGFYFRIREINNYLYLQISPKSTFEFKTDVYGFLKDPDFSEDFIQDLCQRIRLPSGRLAYLRTILGKTCNEPIKEIPYSGQSFFEHAQKINKMNLTEKDARLLVILLSDTNSLTYSSSEGVKPIIDFTSLASMDPDTYSSITKKLKSQSAKRRDLALSYIKSLNLFFNEIRVKIGARQTYPGNYDEKMDFVRKFDSTPRFFKFSDPVVNFRDKNGNIKIASKDTNDRAAPQDLLGPKSYKPFSVPKEINLTILTHKGLEDAADALKEAMQGKNPATINLQEILGCKFNIQNIVLIPTDDSFPSINSDCAIVVGHKKSIDNYDQTEDEYTISEVKILEQGIPAQYVTHSPSSNPLTDQSVFNKIRNPYTFFEIGLSIIAKIGGNSMVLSHETTKEFVYNNVILGYNLARVFEHVDSSIKQSESPLSLVKTSIPLSATVSIMNASGSEITHQYPHIIPDENSLFKGERGQILFDSIPETVYSIVIHKDGQFRKSELDDLKKLQKKDMMIYPISIVTSNVPRISTSILQSHNVPKSGTCLPLSSNEFLLSTTLIPSDYNPITKGWPNPLLIEIHQLGEKTINDQVKKRLLFQIWSLTRSHPASLIPTRRPISIHYSNKIAKFIRKVGKAEPMYFKKFGNQKNRFGFYPKPFL